MPALHASTRHAHLARPARQYEYDGSMPMPPDYVDLATIEEMRRSPKPSPQPRAATSAPNAYDATLLRPPPASDYITMLPTARRAQARTASLAPPTQTYAGGESEVI